MKCRGRLNTSFLFRLPTTHLTPGLRFYWCQRLAPEYLLWDYCMSNLALSYLPSCHLLAMLYQNDPETLFFSFSLIAATAHERESLSRAPFFCNIFFVFVLCLIRYYRMLILLTLLTSFYVFCFISGPASHQSGRSRHLGGWPVLPPKRQEGQKLPLRLSTTAVDAATCLQER